MKSLPILSLSWEITSQYHIWSTTLYLVTMCHFSD
jgi:hypothetical protein